LYSLADPGVLGVALFESKSLLCNLGFGDFKLRLGSGDLILIFGDFMLGDFILGDFMLDFVFELKLDLFDIELELDHLLFPAFGVFVLLSSNLDAFLLFLLFTFLYTLFAGDDISSVILVAEKS